MAVLDVGLTDPTAQAALEDPRSAAISFSGFSRNRASSTALSTELRRVWSGHRNILPETTSVASGSMSANPGEAQPAQPQRVHDEQLKPEIERVWKANRCVLTRNELEGCAKPTQCRRAVVREQRLARSPRVGSAVGSR